MNIAIVNMETNHKRIVFMLSKVEHVFQYQPMKHNSIFFSLDVLQCMDIHSVSSHFYKKTMPDSFSITYIKKGIVIK